MRLGEYIIEYVSVGNQVKVTAIDTLTGIEAVIISPTTHSKKFMADHAIKKLERLIKNKK